MTAALEGRFERACALSVGALLCFAAFAQAARDLWAATVVHIAVLCLAVAVLLRRCWPAQGPGLRTGFLLPSVCMAAAFTASFAGAGAPGEAWLAWTDGLCALLLLLCAAEIMGGDGSADLLSSALSVIVWVELAVVFRQRLGAISFLAHQAPGTMVNANVLAAFIVAWIPVLADRAVRSRGSRKTFAYWAATLLAALLVLSGLDSTWSVIALLVGLPLLPGPRRVLDFAHRNRRPVLICAAGGAAVVAAMLVWKFTHRYDWAGDPLPPGETTQRFKWWTSAWRMFLDHPWTGVGLGNFGSAYLAYKTPGAQNTLFSHGYPFGLLAEAGLSGALGVLLLLGAWIRSLWKAPQVLERRWPWILGAALMLFCALINLSIEYLANLLSLAVLMGAALSACPAPRARPRRSVVLVLAAAALAAVPALLAPFFASRLVVEAEARLAAGELDLSLRGFDSAAGLDGRALEPRRGAARALYARFLARRDPSDLEAAVYRQKDALSRDRFWGAGWAELGAYLRTAGRSEEALAAYQKAVALNAPGDGPRAAVEELLKARR